MVLCFIGVMSLVLFKPSNKTEQLDSETIYRTFGILLMFVVAWTQAAINVTNRKLRDVHFLIIGFFHPILGFIITIVWILANKIMTGEGMGSHSMSIYILIFVSCCFDFTQLCSQNIAFQSASSGFVSVMSYISIAYGFLADELIFHTSITGMELMGATLIMVVCFTTAVLKLRMEEKKG